MGAYSRAAIRDAAADRRIRINDHRAKIAGLASLIDELVQLQIDMVEDGMTHAAAAIGSDLIALRAELNSSQSALRAMW